MSLLPDPPESPRRPTPVRVLMSQEAAERAGVERAAVERVAVEPEFGKEETPGQGRERAASQPPLIIEVDGAEWTVSAAGTARTGTGSDRGAPLLLVRFERSGEGSEQGTREALAVATSLDEMSYDALLELMARSRPVLPSSGASSAAGRGPSSPRRPSE